MERPETPLFDNKAFREAIINAVLHNLWVSGNEPMISVFSDRIEILSRGTLPPAQTMEGFFLGESVPVNEKLSEIFLQLHISEKSGRGVPKIIETYGREAFTFRENSIVVTIPLHRYKKRLGIKVGNKVRYGLRGGTGADPGGDRGRFRMERNCFPFTPENDIETYRGCAVFYSAGAGWILLQQPGGEAGVSAVRGNSSDGDIAEAPVFPAAFLIL